MRWLKRRLVFAILWAVELDLRLYARWEKWLGPSRDQEWVNFREQARWVVKRRRAALLSEIEAERAARQR